MKFAVCFCVHSGELEIKALLLAASLRKHWPANVELIACVPQDPQFGGLSTNTAQILDSLGVRVTSVCNPIGPDYPIANKLLCLDVETEADRLLFLDSDILAVEVVSAGELEETFGRDFVAKPADLDTSTLDDNDWESLYAEFGLSHPAYCVKATSTGKEMPPYFNSGVLATNANSAFGILWASLFSEVARLHPKLAKLHVFDQIPLSLALSKSGCRVRLLKEIWNFPAHLKAMEGFPRKLCHYHWPDVILRQPALVELATRLAAGAPQLVCLMEQCGVWTELAKEIKMNAPRCTGLPLK